jgi:serine/threonine protein kinase
MLAYGRSLDPARAIRIADGAAAGLSAAHAAGVVHLDVKPENIFLVHQPDGSELVKILDFGLAQGAFDPAGSRVEAACATPEYMAPEQQRGVPAAPTMDVYALGVVLLEMLTGHAPGAPRGSPADLPPRLARIVQRALAPSPADRFPAMEDLREALAAAPTDAPAARLAGAGR